MQHQLVTHLHHPCLVIVEHRVIGEAVVGKEVRELLANVDDPVQHIIARPLVG